MKSKIIFFLLAFSVWCLLHYPVDKQHLVIGIVVALLVALLTGEKFTKRPQLFLQPKRYLWLLYYIPLFVWECIRSNSDIAWRLLQPKVSTHPGCIDIKTHLKTDIALTYFANTMTLAMPIIVIDIDKKQGLIRAHGIDTKDIASTSIEKRAQRFEAVLKNIFE